MTLDRLLAFWALAGAVLGLVVFAAVAAMADSFAAASEFADLPSVRGRGIGLLLVPGIGAGWACFALASRLTGDAGVRRWGPLAVCGVLALGVALLLERSATQVDPAVLLPPTVVAVAAWGVTIGVCEWLDA
ncbi:MAG: hypothetical protein ACF8LK_03090 [Phycisphaerales bacterium JB041]